MGLADSWFFIILFGGFLSMVLGIVALLLVGFYFIRCKQIGEELARRETKIIGVFMVVFALVLVLSGFILGFMLISVEPSRIEDIVVFLMVLLIASIIAFHIYWWIRIHNANKSGLFKVPIKASAGILFLAFVWPILGILHHFTYSTLSTTNPFEPLIILCYFLASLAYVVMWLRPTWHVTEAGIYWYWAFIKWEKIVGQEWQPRNDKEVLLRLQLKRLLPTTIPLTQHIPIDYERPLKEVIQKHIDQKEQSPLP